MESNTIIAFEEFCQKNNMKKTNQRFAVFEAVYCNETHPTVEDIVKLVRAKMPMITVESIYRILNDFSAVKLIGKMANSSLMRYDCNMQEHSHFVCTSCNKIVDVHNLEVKLPPELVNCKNISFTINALCEDCAKA